jgi:hypothetical protein
MPDKRCTLDGVRAAQVDHTSACAVARRDSDLGRRRTLPSGSDRQEWAANCRVPLTREDSGKNQSGCHGSAEESAHTISTPAHCHALTRWRCLHGCSLTHLCRGEKKCAPFCVFFLSLTWCLYQHIRLCNWLLLWLLLWL